MPLSLHANSRGALGLHPIAKAAHADPDDFRCNQDRASEKDRAALRAYVERHSASSGLDEIDHDGFNDALKMLRERAPSDAGLADMLMFVVAFSRVAYTRFKPFVTKKQLIDACDEVADAINEVGHKIEDLGALRKQLVRYGDVTSMLDVNSILVGLKRVEPKTLQEKIGQDRSESDKRIRVPQTKRYASVPNLALVCTPAWYYAGGVIEDSYCQTSFGNVSDAINLGLKPGEPLTAGRHHLNAAKEHLKSNPIFFDAHVELRLAELCGAESRFKVPNIQQQVEEAQTLLTCVRERRRKADC